MEENLQRWTKTRSEITLMVMPQRELGSVVMGSYQRAEARVRLDLRKLPGLQTPWMVPTVKVLLTP